MAQRPRFIETKGNKFIKTFFVVVILSVFHSCGTIDKKQAKVGIQSDNATQIELERMAQNLSSSNFLESTKAARDLYKLGERSIPYLVGQFENESKFTGYCGFGSVQANYVIVTDDELGKSTRSRALTVSEVALYLIIAIKKARPYFAWDCYINEALEQKPDQLKLALMEIKQLYSQSLLKGHGFTLESIETILAENDLRFNLVQ